MTVKRDRGKESSIDTTSIDVDPKAYINRAKIENRDIEGNYRARKWAIVQKCAISVDYARKHRDFRKFVERSDFWRDARQKPPKYSADWCTKFILDPQTDGEKATAGRYAAVIEYLQAEKVAPDRIAAELKTRGGIERVYAESTGRKTDQKEEGVKEAVVRNYDKDDLHARWTTEEQRDDLFGENGDKTLTVRVAGKTGEFKKVTILEVHPA